MTKLINKIGIGKIKNAFNDIDIKELQQQKSSVEEIGVAIAFEIAEIILESLPKCEDDIYNMLESVSNLTRKELEKIDMGIFFEMIVDFIQKSEFKDFIKVASKLFK